MPPTTPAPLKNLELQNSKDLSHSSVFPLLAIDYGSKKCGLAYSPDGIVALPHSIVETKKLESTLKEIIAEKSIKALVWGLPLASDGTENQLCSIIRTLHEEWEKILPSFLVNERYSTQSTLSTDDNPVDDLSAAKILEYFFAKK